VLSADLVLSDVNELCVSHLHDTSVFKPARVEFVPDLSFAFSDVALDGTVTKSSIPSILLNGTQVCMVRS
jgi:hypothetical protein